jgi:acetyl/propionyl-CoA carboxylase alpha subunit
MSKIGVTIQGKNISVTLEPQPLIRTHLVAQIEGRFVQVKIPDGGDASQQFDWMIIDNRPYEVCFDPELRWVRVGNFLYALEVRDSEAAVSRPASSDGRMKAPIPGMIRQVMVQVGDQVIIGQPVLVLEAMKMENEICAPLSGTIIALHAVVGQGVALNELLAEIA